MAFGTLKLNLSTVLSITFIPCCKIVLMFYNVLQLYFSSGKIKHSHSEIPNFYKYKQIIEFNPMTAIEYSSCYKYLLL